MTVAARVQASVEAYKSTTSGLTASVERHPIAIGVDVGDCDKVWSDRRTFTVALSEGRDGPSADDINLASFFTSAIKLLLIKNLSSSHSIALTAAPSLGQFRLFLQDTDAWNFSPMINTGSLTLRGYPILPGGAFLTSCPNSSGFSITTGGSILRIGGRLGESYEIYALGT